MARIHRRAAGTWEVVIEAGRDPRNGKRLRETFTVKGTKRDAERTAAERSAAIARGTFIDPSRETVGEFLLRWLADYVDVSISLRSQLVYRDIVNGVLIPHLGALPLQQLKPAHVLAMEQALRSSGKRRTGGALAPATIRKIHNVLHRAMSHAVRWQALALNPVDAVDPPAVFAAPPKALSPAQARTLLAALSGQEFELPLRTALLCGLRLGELLGLRWGDVDVEHQRFLVVQALDSRHDGAVRFKVTKTHRSARPVSVPPSLLAALADHREVQRRQRAAAGETWADYDLVFATDIGLPLSGAWMRKCFYRILDGAGLPRIPLHGLRHTMATLMLASGEHPKVVSERLGHSNPAFTLTVYGHVIPGMHEDASRRLEQALEVRDGAQGV